jgi:PAT family beta-lactamase induction signal transducer AmpG
MMQTEKITVLKQVLQPKVLTMFFFGISAGLPLLLIFSSLSLWLREAGVERATVTYFSWAALGYSFKFLWAPLVDVLPLPFLTKHLGRRRSWLLLSQLLIMMAIVMMAFIDPRHDALTLMGVSAVLLGFSSATQDVALDAYRIESAEQALQALLSSSYIAGYRTGMLMSGAGALLLASHFGSTLANYNYLAWQATYLLMGSAMLIGIVTTLMVNEPKANSQQTLITNIHSQLKLILLFAMSVTGFVLCFAMSSGAAEELKTGLQGILNNQVMASFAIEVIRVLVALAVSYGIARLCVQLRIVEQTLLERTYIAPVKDYFTRYGWTLAWLLLALIGLYRISDSVLGVISNVFYQDLGFSKADIARVVKTFGLMMTIVGGFLGGILVLRYGVMRILFLGALLSALTNLMFMLLAYQGHDMTLLYIVISADNLSAGLASAAFIAFLSGLTNISFTAVQYAIFSSLMTLLPKALGGYSGSMVEMVGYETFFLFTALLGIPVLLLIIIANKRFKLHPVEIR